MTEAHTSDRDVFIAHASEEKTAFVRPLAEKLRQLGLRVWYDEFEIKPGDSLVGSIDRGLAASRSGVMVLSKAFFAKAWPDYERRGLTVQELAQRVLREDQIPTEERGEVFELALLASIGALEDHGKELRFTTVERIRDVWAALLLDMKPFLEDA